MRFSKQQLRVIKSALEVDIAQINTLIPRVTHVSIPSLIKENLIKEKQEYEEILRLIEEDE